MSEETDAHEGGADDVTTSEAVETTSEATTEQTTATETAEEPDAGEATKRVPWFQKRIDEVTADKYAERNRADRLEAELTRLRDQSKAPEPEAVRLPTLEQFDYDEAKYAAALAKHFQDSADRAIDEKLTKRQRETAETQKNETAIAKLKDGGAKHPDFIAAVSGIPATEAIRDFILEEPKAADVLYELGKDVAATERFNSLSPYQQAIELGRRAATPKAATSKAIPPPPPETVAGLASGLTKPLGEMSYAEFKAAREAEEKNRN